MMDDAASILPTANEVDLLNDWELLAGYNLENMFIPCLLSLFFVLFGIGMVFGRYADNKMARDLNALEERMFLLGGDVTSDPHGEAEKATASWKQKCWLYWKCWKCNKVSFCHSSNYVGNMIILKFTRV